MDFAKMMHHARVFKVYTELDNHFGILDYKLAEFIIHLAEEDPTSCDFATLLFENGFPESFILSTLPVIHSITEAVGVKRKLSLNEMEEDELMTKIAALTMGEEENQKTARYTVAPDLKISKEASRTTQTNLATKKNENKKKLYSNKQDIHRFFRKDNF